MTNPITPPPELVEQWEAETAHTTKDEIWHVAVQAAQWGANQELEACCEWFVRDWTDIETADKLRSARRSKPPSLKQQALAVLDDCSDRLEGAHKNIIRRALEALDD